MKKNIINNLLILLGIIIFYSSLLNADESNPASEQVAQEQVQAAQPNADGPRPGMMLNKALENHPEEQAKMDLNQDGIVDQNERRAALETLRQNQPLLPPLPTGNPAGTAQEFKNRPRPIPGQGPLANIRNSTSAQHQGVSQDPNSES